MSVVGLFAGIGGFELAFGQAGFESELLVEIDPAASAVLRNRFPNAEVRADVADLRELPRSTTIVTAGFPCQNLSMAGDKTGISGTKSGVVRRMLELIQRSRVPTVVIENVYFMLQLDSGRAMESLVQEFEDLGYYWAYRVLDTIGFGLPHRRRRVYFVASREMDPRTVLFADESAPRIESKPDLSAALGFYWTEGRSGVGLTADGIPPLKVGSSIGIPSAPAVLFTDGEVLMPSLEACERLQGFEPGWTALAGDHAGKRAEWRMIGNAVSVPVARWVAERIRNPGTVVDFSRVPVRPGHRWPNGAWNVGHGRQGISASDKPVFTVSPSISTFRDGLWTRLSDRALDGFINRANAGRLRMPDGFIDALRRAPRSARRKARSLENAG